MADRKGQRAVRARAERELADVQRRQKEHQDAKRRQRLLVAGGFAAGIAAVVGLVWLGVRSANQASTNFSAAIDKVVNAPEATASPVVPSCKKPSKVSTTAQSIPANYDQIRFAPTYKYGLTLKTNCGDVTILLDQVKAPNLVKSLIYLANTGTPVRSNPKDSTSKIIQKTGYFDNSPCHRLTTQGIFVLQCGDPTGTGTGGPGYTVADENTNPGLADAGGGSVIYPRYAVVMANSGPNTNGSQFFIVYKDSPLPPNYSVVGIVQKGMSIVDKVAQAGVKGGGSDGKPLQPLVLSKVNSFEQVPVSP